jgi:dynein heavy chain, axonemal
MREEKKGEEGDAGAAGEGSAAEGDEGGPAPALLLSPPNNVVKTALRGVLYDAMVIVSAPPRLLTHADFAP